MYNLALGQYSAEEMSDMLHRDRTVFYEFYVTDKDDHPLGKITASGSVDFNATATIQRAASLKIKEERDINFFSDRIKPYMCLQTPSGVARFPMGVFLPSSPRRTSSGERTESEIECYDKTQILSDDRFPQRHNIPAGTNYVSAIASILTSAGIGDSKITPTTKETAVDLEFEIGTSKLDAINQLLRSINYYPVYADANGHLVIKPYEVPMFRTIDAVYATDKKSIVLTGASEQTDFFHAPNQIVRYLETADRGCLIATYTNNDPSSELSTVRRGRTITDVAAVSDIADQATLDAYTLREYAESQIYQSVTFESAVMPNHEYLDCIYIINKDLDIQGKYIEQSWHAELVTGGKMRHVCRKAVSV